jgi:hypothetical protein
MFFAGEALRLTLNFANHEPDVWRLPGGVRL